MPRLWCAAEPGRSSYTEFCKALAAVGVRQARPRVVDPVTTASARTMTDYSILWLRVAAVLYLIGLTHSIVTLLRRESRLFQVALVAVQAAVVFHLVSMWNTLYVGAPAGLATSLKLPRCAPAVRVVFLIVYWRYNSRPEPVHLSLSRS